MSVEDATASLLKASESDALSSLNQDLATKIVEELGCLAIAIVFASTVIRRDRCTLEEYSQKVRQYEQRLLNDKSCRLNNVQARNVYASWEMVRDSIARSDDKCAKSALELLNVFSCFHYEGISENIFESAWSVTDFKATDAG